MAPGSAAWHKARPVDGKRKGAGAKEGSGRGRARGKGPRRYTATPPNPPTRAGQWRGVTRSPRVGVGADSHEFTRTPAFVDDDGGPGYRGGRLIEMSPCLGCKTNTHWK